MQINPYLFFKGDCEAAIQFYGECLGARIEFKLTYGESPMAKQTPPDQQNKILHARISVGGQILMVCDAPPERYDAPAGFFVSLGFADPAEAERVYGALAENGTVFMPIQETFWAQRFGMVADRFGIPWMINCEKAP